jgi:aspartate carbamoyltransferase catalytic subunit
VPVINAGDGQGGQHPTQALLDLSAIYRERPLDGLSIAFIGELARGRSVRSLAYLLARFDRLKLVFVSLAELQMRPTFSNISTATTCTPTCCWIDLSPAAPAKVFKSQGR